MGLDRINNQLTIFLIKVNPENLHLTDEILTEARAGEEKLEHAGIDLV